MDGDAPFPKKLLVTGASGFLGWNLCQLATRDWKVYGTYFSQFVDIPGVTLVKVDLRNLRESAHLFKEIQPDAVIHTAAQSSPNYCQTHTKESYRINVTSSVNIATFSALRDIPCAFTSTDLVFDGKNPPYRETDPVSPISHYGEQKVTAEAEMRSRYPQVTICRMPLMFGLAPPKASSFIQPFIKTLRQGKELSLFTDEYRTPVSAATAAKGLLIALENTAEILHLGGKERVSRYDFGRIMTAALELSQELLTPCRQQDIQMAAPRPPDVSLDSSKAFALGYRPLSLREELAALRGKI